MLFSVLPDTSTGAGVSVESSVITSVVSVRSVSAFVSLCPASGSVAVDAFSEFTSNPAPWLIDLFVPHSK